MFKYSSQLITVIIAVIVSAHTVIGQASCNDSTLVANNSIKYIQSPNFPGDYPNNTDCVWHIKTNSNNTVISLIVTSLILESSSNCQNDYLAINDGQYRNPSLVKKLCRWIQTTVAYQSMGSEMAIAFHTDSSDTYAGFHLEYHTVLKPTSVAQCSSSTLTAASYPNTIQSPNFPLNYADLTDCVWYITTSYNYLIFLNITSFNLEYDTNCADDFLSIHDGASQFNNQMAKLCGPEITTTMYQSTGSTMTIVFQTDQGGNFGGFSLDYNYVLKPSQNISLCGNVDIPATSTTKYLQSPNYPYFYPNNVDCVWHISTSSYTDVIYIKVTSLSLESSSLCGDDYLKIIDGSSIYSNPLATLCGTRTSVTKYQSTGSSMTIVFHSDSYFASSGFYLLISTSLDVDYTALCGSTALTATASSQNIQSPNYPSYYPDNTDCIWYITTNSASDAIYVKITPFSLESTSDCSYDYLKILDGPSTYSSQIAKICGTYSSTIKYHSSGSSMTLVFHSDGSTHYSGFYLSFSTTYDADSTGQCGSSTLTAYSYSNHIESPNYPSNYPNDADCVWHITAESYSDQIYIDISSFSTESTYPCSYDYLEILDGSSTTSSQIVKLCGSYYSTLKYHSTGSTMTLVFHSDGSTSYSGFYLTYSTISNEDSADLSGGVIAAIVISSLAAPVILIVVIAFFVRRSSARKPAQTTTRPAVAPRNQNVVYYPTQPVVITTGTVPGPSVQMGNTNAAFSPPMYQYPNMNAGAPNTMYPYSAPVAGSNIAPPVYPGNTVVGATRPNGNDGAAKATDTTAGESSEKL